MAKKLRVLMVSDISGEGVEYHVGDEAMAEVAINRLKEICGAENITMACASPEDVPKTYGIKATAFYNLEDAKRRALLWKRPQSFFKGFFNMLYQLNKVDVLFICGGGNITSQWPGVMESRLYYISWALKLKKRVILVSQTLGPFSEKHRKQCADVLAKVEWVGVRDKHFSHTQIDSPVHYAVDDASFLPATHSEMTRQLIADKRPCIAFSMRKLGEANDHLLEKLCNEVAAFGHQQQLNTIFIPHHSPNGEGDIRLAKNNLHLWPAEQPLHIIEPIPMASPLKALTAECELTISMRYHQIIFALATGVPTIGIYVNEYTQAKLRGAFEQFGLEPNLLSINDIEGKLAALATATIKNKAAYTAAAEYVRSTALNDNLKPYNLLRG